MKPIKLNEDQKVEIKRLVTALYENADTYKNKTEASQGADYYYCRLPKSPAMGSATTVMPVVKTEIDSLHNQIMDVVGKLKDNFTAQSLDINKPLPPAVEAQIVTLIDNTIFSEEDENVINVVVKEALIAGTSAARYYTDKEEYFDLEYFTDLTEEELTFRKAKLRDEQTLEITSTKDVELSDGKAKLYCGQVSTAQTMDKVRYAHVSYNDLYVDPTVNTISKASYAAIRSLMTKADLIEQGYSKELVAEITTETDYDVQAQFNTGNELISRYNAMNTYSDSMMDNVIVVEHFVKTSLIDGVAKLYKVVIADETLLEVTPEDKIPVVEFIPVPNIDSFWGASVAFSLRSIQDGMTSSMRGMINGIHNANHHRVIALKGQYNKRDLMDNRPNGIVEVESPNAVIPFPYNPMPQGIDLMMSILQEQAQNIAGTSNALLGKSEAVFQSSATAVAIANSKGELNIKNISKGIMNGVRDLCKGLYNEYRKLYQNLPQVSTFKFEVATESGRRGKAMDVIQTAQALQQAGLMTPQLMDALGKEYLRNVGLSDMVGFLKTPDMIAQEQQAQQQNPANQMQIAMMQEQLKNLQAQTQKLVAETEIKADIEASRMDLEEQKAKVEVQHMIAEANLKDRKQTLDEVQVGLQSKVALLELALKAEEVKYKGATSLALDASEKLTTTSNEVGF